MLHPLAASFLAACREDVLRAEASLEGHGFGELARLGHRIKGTGPALGLPEAGRAGAGLEAAAKAQDGPRVSTELAALKTLLGAA